MSGAEPTFGQTSRSRSQFCNGRELKAGTYYRAISSGTGEVIDSETYLLATNVTDKKDNILLVNTNTGEGTYASATSIWQTV